MVGLSRATSWRASTICSRVRLRQGKSTSTISSSHQTYFWVIGKMAFPSPPRSGAQVISPASSSLYASTLFECMLRRMSKRNRPVLSVLVTIRERTPAMLLAPIC